MKLRDVLQSYKVGDLKKMAGNWNIPEFSRCRKAELIEKINGCVLDPARLSRLLPYLEPAEMDRLRSGRGGFLPEDRYTLLSFPLGHGLLSLPDDTEYRVPDDVADAIRPLDTPELRRQQEHQTKIRKYGEACTELYGILPAGKAAEIYTAQTGNPLTGDEMLEAAADPFRPFHFAVVYDGCLADESLWAVCEDDSEADDLRLRQEGKPYYIPPQPELLKYADGLYFERNSQYDAMVQYIRRHFAAAKAEDICEDIQASCGMEFELDDILSEMERMGAVLQSKKQFEEFLTYLINLMNHTRLWSLRGHTPAELQEEHPVVADIREFVAEQPREVGRNDPCPCGSGKKYKKCCGAKE